MERNFVLIWNNYIGRTFSAYKKFHCELIIFLVLFKSFCMFPPITNEIFTSISYNYTLTVTGLIHLSAFKKFHCKIILPLPHII